MLKDKFLMKVLQTERIGKHVMTADFPVKAASKPVSLGSTLKRGRLHEPQY